MRTALLLLAFVPFISAVVFEFPIQNNYFLDYCREFATDCGAPAAQAYCQAHGYLDQIGFAILSSVHQKTQCVGSGAICDPTQIHCDSFQFIECLEQSHRFNAPVIDGYRLDWCREPGADCGAPAADAYCQSLNFAGQSGFAIQPSVTFKTFVIDTGFICNGATIHCDAFNYIICHR